MPEQSLAKKNSLPAAFVAGCRARDVCLSDSAHERFSSNNTKQSDQNDHDSGFSEFPPLCQGRLMLRVALATLIITLVLLGPVLVQAIERNVELFFLVIGVLTAFTMRQFNTALLTAALIEPLAFTLAVLVFGASFRFLRDYLDQIFRRVIEVLDPPDSLFLHSSLTGLFGRLHNSGCSGPCVRGGDFLISLRSTGRNCCHGICAFRDRNRRGLTPLGMPGIAVVLSLSARRLLVPLPHLLGPFIVVGVILAAVPTLFLPFGSNNPVDVTGDRDSWRLVLLVRPGKVYVFIAGLVALSDGLRPLVDAYLHRIPNGLLFWMHNDFPQLSTIRRWRPSR